jgi:hypothetical protein
MGGLNRLIPSTEYLGLPGLTISDGDQTDSTKGWYD